MIKAARKMPVQWIHTVASIALRQFGLVFLLLPMLSGQPPAEPFQKLLPVGARVIETADVTAIAGRPRTMVLWMERPARHSGGPEYCGTSVHGDFFEGPTRLSLLSPGDPSLINTIDILGRGTDGVGARDSFQIPFFVSNDYYHVPRPNASGRGTPEILHLQDFTGDGELAQFVLFMYDACGIVSTSVLGYAQQSDRVVQYPVEVTDAGGKHVESWVEQIFATKAVQPGRWKFSWRPGHGSEEILNEDVSFDRAKQVFVEKHTTSRPLPGRK